MSDAAAELHALEQRILAGTPHPSHVFCRGPLVECVHCELFAGDPKLVLACTKVNSGKFEACCECGEPYPRADLIAGEVFCPKCRGAAGASA